MDLKSVLFWLVWLSGHQSIANIPGSFSCGNNTWLEDRACLPWDYNKLKKPTEKVKVDVWFKVTDIMKIDSQGGGDNFSLCTADK